MRELTPEEVELIAGGDSTQFYGGNDYDWYVRGASQPEHGTGPDVILNGSYDINTNTESIYTYVNTSYNAISGDHVVVYSGMGGNLQAVNLYFDTGNGPANFNLSVSQLQSGNIVTENLGNGHSVDISYIPNYLGLAGNEGIGITFN